MDGNQIGKAVEGVIRLSCGLAVAVVILGFTSVAFFLLWLFR